MQTCRHALQAALVYVLLASSDKALSTDDVAEAAEKLLEETLQLQVSMIPYFA